jgi:hypothetical protein
MPAWADHSDEELWGTVAFIEKLPGMSEADHATLVMESMKQGGRHSRGGGGDDEHGRCRGWITVRFQGRRRRPTTINADAA